MPNNGMKMDGLYPAVSSIVSLFGQLRLSQGLSLYPPATYAWRYALNKIG
jgi:hypothetical protein